MLGLDIPGTGGGIIVGAGVRGTRVCAGSCGAVGSGVLSSGRGAG